MLTTIAYIICFGFIFESISWLFRIRKGFEWILKNQNTNEFIHSQIKTYLIIPVLEETHQIHTVAAYFDTHFLKPLQNVSLVFVTTEKERLSDASSQTTIELAEALAVANPSILHFHYPKTDGKMSHQLNYSIKKIKGHSTDFAPILFGIYNADSRPDSRTLAWVLGKYKEGSAEVFQQYGSYIGNLVPLSKISWSATLSSGAMWQTRWAIGFEIYNAIKQPSYRFSINYCIGHGLFISSKIIEKVGGFSETTHNEDAVLGLKLSYLKQTINPVPFFDVSESPSSILSLYNQKASWYWGPLQAYQYIEITDLRSFVIVTKLFFHALYWILGPSFLFFSLLSAIVTYDLLLLTFTLISAFGFLALPSFISFLYAKKINPADSASSLGSRKALGLLIKGSLVAYLFHGLSAYKGAFDYLKYLLFGKTPTKPKTETKTNSYVL